jgi:hypothetical protein
MYLPRNPNAQPAMPLAGKPAMTIEPGAPTLPPQSEAQQSPARKSARRLTRNPVLAGIVNNAMRMWK